MEFSAFVAGVHLAAVVGSELSESEVALRFIFFVGGSIASIYLVDKVLKKILKIEKNKSSTDSYVNDLHKKWDKIISLWSGIALTVITFILFNTNASINLFLLLPVAALPFLPTIIQVGFEKKYAENPNDYLYTLLGLGMSSGIIITLLLIFSPGI
ncbi:DUF4181 domain-containing protein [Planococcus faecalis]|uniref:DUF4181 domain-containing protein n=1 Tax=Planococcus faecalis TaxID=1598147 RepID=A0ABN4XUB6_9BACL|nr:DUF4181 domain-containing protein [Planococcus faecalis]AQU80824.1 hypothetical protein AJGP001_16690 [Planococcus faecalis]OHX55807.1 hypothetical protein BB777_01265 [Planococcus faecalis]